MDEDYELYSDAMRHCSNIAHNLARNLRFAADIAPEESCIGPCIRLADYLDHEAHSMNPDGPAWQSEPGGAEIISFEEEARKRGRM